MPKGNTTQNRGRGPEKGTGGRPVTGQGFRCYRTWPDPQVVDWLNTHPSIVIALSREWAKTQTAQKMPELGDLIAEIEVLKSEIQKIESCNKLACRRLDIYLEIAVLLNRWLPGYEPGKMHRQPLMSVIEGDLAFFNDIMDRFKKMIDALEALKTQTA